MAPRPPRCLALAALAVAALAAAPGPAAAEHGGCDYRGHYANAFVAGKAEDGRKVAVMGGYHTDFPYHDAGSGYDQIAVFVGGEQPVVVTGRPALAGFELAPADGRTRLAYSGAAVRFELEFRSAEQPPLYEGDPADLGDLLVTTLPIESDRRPGFVYTPYELTRLVAGELVLPAGPGERRIELRALHGQAEAGVVEAPTDRRFRSAYDYIAAPTPAAHDAYTYVGFESRALHDGPDGALGPYFAATASDEFTLERGQLAEGNAHGAIAPFDNTAGLPPGAHELARWRTDLGPGVLHRALVRTRDASGRRLIALSETIVEDRER